ncbi:hypothetical protein AHMF7605_21580 [Adhaeribacter arboris]|uniref:Uncharacterized protein n=1 Tax=Adhaeribacter arboris TaxID=2072846 RepID=A0A2T2YK67_9BACT|nr:hypothetical protein [Adhaeribacter arboris]PSR55906.1 hypothetical protein AHMF7605_21580 [Adhaeribacter arboris]
MNLYYFHQLPSEDRATLVWEQGEFLTVRVSGNCNVCLYDMRKFFAEIWYRVEENEVEAVRGFTSNSCLEPYLNLVDLSDIIR